MTARNFTVGQYVSHLDIVVIKDSPATSVALLAPNGQRFPPATAGAFISTDPYYAIFAIDSPQQGPWEVDMGGSGTFLMNSLKVSALALGITAPAANAVLALGEQFTVSASLSAQDTPISGGRFTLAGTITYVGGSAAPYAQDIVLADAVGSGVYSATVTVPTSAPSGSYAIAISAHAASEDVLTAETAVRLDLFPAALLISPVTHSPTTGTVGASVVGWDPILRTIYRLPVIGGLGGLALDDHAADPAAVVRGQVLLNGHPYGDATVAGTATRVGSTSSVPVNVFNDGRGAFRLVFPSDASGTYRVNLATSGTYTVSHGDLTHVIRSVLVTITPATPGQEARAWLVTLIYLLLLLFFGLCIRYVIAPKPFGGLQLQPAAPDDDYDEFNKVKRSPLTWLLHPSNIWASEMGVELDSPFSFTRGHIWVDGQVVDGKILKETGAQGALYKVIGKSDIVESEDPEADARYEDEASANDSSILAKILKAPWRSKRQQDSDDHDYDFGYSEPPSSRPEKRQRKGRSRNKQESDDYDFGSDYDF